MRKIILTLCCLFLLTNIVNADSPNDVQWNMDGNTAPTPPVAGKVFHLYLKAYTTDNEWVRGHFYIESVDENNPNGDYKLYSNVAELYSLNKVDWIALRFDKEGDHTLKVCFKGDELLYLPSHNNGPEDYAECTRVITVHVNQADDSTKDMIPEFPTIAAPITILLGLMVVFRKKD